MYIEDVGRYQIPGFFGPVLFQVVAVQLLERCCLPSYKHSCS